MICSSVLIGLMKLGILVSENVMLCLMLVRSPPPLPFALSMRIAEYVGICGVLLCFFIFVS